MAQGYATETDQEGGPVSGGPGGRFRLRLPHSLLGSGIWRRGLVLAAVAILLALLMLLHSHIPNTVGNLGSLIETFLPWCGLLVPLLLIGAVVRRSASAVVALVLPTVVWFNLFGGLLLDRTGPGGDLTVATHNVNAENPDPTGTARDVAASGADVVALQELAPAAVPVYKKVLAATYPYHSVQGTVGLWSKYPMRGTKSVDIKLGWVRALRTEISTPAGVVAVYEAHLPSVRVKLNAGFTASERDHSADALGQAIRREPQRRVVLLGDLNGTMNDRALKGVTAQMRSTQGAAGSGFGFSWPAAFPMARIDQIMVRDVEPVTSWTLPRTGSDHLPVAAKIRIGH
ncbi:endonuclease/exonuclease/phosphatase family protein [Streptomyces sp. NPDC058045]|uniref:endonuclease/exonuclease/phosphatase family protein n=1 Tax=Streptomyces sp. NPDC058045 TaxID=3346311 RepID=UPI0036EC2497